MRLIAITLVFCACVWVSAGDVAHLKAAKARLIGRLAGKHHKRGALSSLPPYKVGHDIPVVTHSVLKPIVVNYPPTASVTAVKVPISHPHVVTHKVPVHNHHFGHKFPHTKTVLLPQPDSHFHHHHHHLAPRPVVPIVPVQPPAPAPLPVTPFVPVPQPTSAVAHPVPAPAPSVLVQPATAPVVPAEPVPVAPPPLHILPQQHVHLRPLLPAPSVPIQPPSFIPPSLPLAPQLSYFLRPGNSIQTSYFATYPRYPLVNYQPPIIPLAAPAAPVVPAAPVAPAQTVVPAPGPVFFDRPQVPHFHLLPQPETHGVVEQPATAVGVEQTPTTLHPTQTSLPQPGLHFHQTQPVPLDHDGWSPVVPQAHDITQAHPDNHNFAQPHEAHHHFTQEQGTQVFEHHTGDEQYHDYQQQLQHHIQQQIEQAQYEQHLHNQHHVGQEYGTPQEYNHQQHIGQEYGQPNHEYTDHNQDFGQHVQDFAQHVQDFAQHAQQGQEYGLPHQQPAQEYGLPQQGLEGRSAEGEDETQRFHNHIPLGLQPPIDRPLEHFR